MKTISEMKNILEGVDAEIIAIKVKITKSLNNTFKIGDVCIWDGVFLEKIEEDK